MPDDKQPVPEERKTVGSDQSRKRKVFNFDSLSITINFALLISFIVGLIYFVNSVSSDYTGVKYDVKSTKEDVEELKERMKLYEDSKKDERENNATPMNLRNAEIKDCDYYNKFIEYLTQKKKDQNCK